MSLVTHVLCPCLVHAQGMILADFGATVIRVDKVKKGEAVANPDSQCPFRGVPALCYAPCNVYGTKLLLQ